MVIMSRSLLAFALTSLGAAILPAQQTFIVSAAGGGQFTDIPPAIAAAAPGDTLLVRPGQYSAFTVGKGIRIIGDPGAVAGNPFSAIQIRGLPAGQALVVQGLAANTLLAAGPTTVADNDGHVHLENLQTTGGLSVRNSAQVSMHNLDLSGSQPAALNIVASTVVITDTRISAQQGFAGVPALRGDTSHVIFAEGMCEGSGPGLRSGPGPGVQLVSGALTIAGDAATEIVAGSGAGAVPAVVALSGTLRLDPAVQLRPANGAPGVAGDARVTVEPVASLSARVATRQLSVRLHATGALRGHLLASLPLMPAVSLPQGQLWIGPAHLVLDSGPVPASGVRTAAIGLPPLPPGFVLALQSIVERPGAIELSTPAVLTLDG